MTPANEGRAAARREWHRGGVLLALVLLLAGCADRSEQAGAASLAADALAQSGDLRGALAKAREATTLADDVGAYWLQLGRLQLAAGTRSGAYDSFQKALESDPYNVEALSTLCGLGLGTGRPDDLDRFADRLLSSNPANPVAQTCKAGAAVLRGDTRGGLRYLDPLLAADPGNLTAALLKARLLSRTPETVGDAVALIEGSLGRGGDPVDRLQFLQTLYRQQGDRQGLRRTTQRLATAAPRDPAAQLALAALLYDEGALAPARAAVLALARAAPDDAGAAAAILELWRDRGSDAMPANGLEAAADGLSPRMRAVFARWANERRRPQVALAILAPVLPAGSAEVAAARAEALTLLGRGPAAQALLADVLRADARLPAALALRARLALAGGRAGAAVADARVLVADDPVNASHRLLLADALQADGESALAEATLREGLRAAPDSVRLAARLAGDLRADDRAGQAADIWRELTANAPTGIRAWSARRDFCAATGEGSCAAEAGRRLAALRG